MIDEESTTCVQSGLCSGFSVLVVCGFLSVPPN